MKLKIFIAVLSCITVCLPAIAQKKIGGPYALRLDMTSMKEKPDTLLMYYFDQSGRKTIYDTVARKGNVALFKGRLEEPAYATLFYRPAGRRSSVKNNYLFFFLEPGNIKVVVKDSLSNSKVYGSVSNTWFGKMKEMKAPFENRLQVLYIKYKAALIAKDSVAAAKLDLQTLEIDEEIKQEVYKPFVEKYGTQTPVALWTLSMYAGYKDMNYTEVEKLFKKIAPVYRNYPSGKVLSESISIAKKTTIGAVAPDFAQNDTSGVPVKLSSFRGKYVLLDFWASWCGPCRAENPNLIKAFNHFKDKGFTILGVSLDHPGKKSDWIKAINNDKLTWTHVSDLKYWNNAVAKLYDIQGVPANFLIDPQGKIIAKDLRGEELDKKLTEILGN